MDLRERVLNKLKKRREVILEGGVNCIPSPFTRYRNTFIGVEQAKYYLVTAATKSYKSQFSSNLFIYNSILYNYHNKDKLDVHILYFPLEETPEAVLERFTCYLLYILSNKSIRISPQDLRSTNENNPLPESIINLLESDQYKDILEYFVQKVIFMNDSNPTGIYSSCKNFIKDRGDTIYKDIVVKDSLTGESKTIKGFDYFKLHNEREYNLIYIDHVSLISVERGMDLRAAMSKLSEYLVLLRNRYNFTPVVIQQQAFFENLDAFKMNKLKPSPANLADNKAISRDANMLISLFTPFTYELQEYMGYNITKFRKNITFLEVLINRDGDSNNVAPLYVDGAVTYFAELPLPTDTQGINKVLDFMNSYKKINKTLFIKLKKLINGNR